MQEAARKANALSGSGSTTELDWMPITVAPNIIVVDSTTSNDPSSPSLESTNLPDESSLLDTDNLEAEDDLDDDEDAVWDEDIIQNASVVICWKLPVSFLFLIFHSSVYLLTLNVGKSSTRSQHQLRRT